MTVKYSASKKYSNAPSIIICENSQNPDEQRTCADVEFSLAWSHPRSLFE
jgi:hypothetical protein